MVRNVQYACPIVAFSGATHTAKVITAMTPNRETNITLIAAKWNVEEGVCQPGNRTS